MNKKILLSIITMVVLFVGQVNATVVYVHPFASGNNDGTSWADAYTSLTNAIDNANQGDSLWMTSFVFRPIGSGVLRAFVIDKSLHLFGGFSGTETNINQRVPGAVSEMTGDYSMNDDPNSYLTNRTDNANVTISIETTSNTPEDITLDGIIISGGYANLNSASNTTGRIGGGIGGNSIGSFNLVVRNCVFRYNVSTTHGAAIGITTKNMTTTNVTLKGCRFLQNGATQSGIIFNYSFGANSTANMVVQDCEILNNLAQSGILVSVSDPGNATNSAHFRMYNNTIIQNGASNNVFGGITRFSQGNSLASTVVIRNTAFSLNNSFIQKDILVTTNGSYTPEVYLYNNYFDITNRVSGTVMASQNEVIGGASLSSCSSTINKGSTALLTGDDFNLINPIVFDTDFNGNPRISYGTIDIGSVEFGGTIIDTVGIIPNGSAIIGLINPNIDTTCLQMQWIDCNTNQPVAGATNAFFTPTQSGIYALEITLTNGLTSTSDCVPFIITNTTDLEALAVNIFPNPVREQMTITNGIGQATIYNVLGQPVKTIIINNEQMTVNVSDLASGQYILHITQKNGNVITKQFVK